MLLGINKKMAAIRRRFRKDESGVSAIEFAFLGGPFLFLLLATFETGLNFLTEYSLQNATTNASRLIRTGQAQNGGLSAAEFKTELCKHVPGFMNCNSKVFVNVETRADFGAAANRTQGGDGSGNLNNSLQNSPAFVPGGPGEIVVVETFYEQKMYVPFINKLLALNGEVSRPNFLANHGDDKRLITGVAVFRNEPFNPAGS